jgi:dihydrofolate reductase
MGRKTWQSLPDKVRPLPGRTNIVVTRFEDYPADGAQIAHSFPEALSLAKDADGADEIFVIGGGELYRAALPFASRLYLTIVDDPTPGTVFFPEYEQDFLSEVEREEHVDGNYRYTWLTLDR